MNPEILRATIRDKYAAIARGETLSCCAPTGSGETTDMIGDSYVGVEGYVGDADLKLGCGLPVEHAGLEPGQTVLDLGSGAGLDAFVARRIVGEGGHVIGVDFTPEMVEKARANATKLGYDNVRFERGDIEALPFADASVDVVISNCVLNLVPDKARAFAEMARVLRPGGHFCISDVVTRGALSAAVRASAELHAGCIAGALDESDYLDQLRSAGFEAAEIIQARPIALSDGLLPDVEGSPLWSVTVRGLRPSSIPSSDSARPTATLKIYEAAMCCSNGLCGPDPDATLVQFAADSRALASAGVDVQRFNLGQTPDAFVANPLVHRALEDEGLGVLPLLILDGKIVCKGRYPTRDELTRLAGLGEVGNGGEPAPAADEGAAEDPSSIFTPEVAELVAIGAAIAANCQPSFRFHHDRARELSVSRGDIFRAVKAAQSVKAPARAMLELAAMFLAPAPAASGAMCCGAGGSGCG